MAQYQVPQFIEVEDAIFGPLSLRQFLMILVPVAIAFMLYFVLTLFFWIILATLLVGGGAALALLKVHDQPVYRIALASAGYVFRPHLYLWKPQTAPVGKPKAPKNATAPEHAIMRLAGKINIFK